MAAAAAGDCILWPMLIVVVPCSSRRSGSRGAIAPRFPGRAGRLLTPCDLALACLLSAARAALGPSIPARLLAWRSHDPSGTARKPWLRLLTPFLRSRVVTPPASPAAAAVSEVAHRARASPTAAQATNILVVVTLGRYRAGTEPSISAPPIKASPAGEKAQSSWAASIRRRPHPASRLAAGVEPHPTSVR